MTHERTEECYELQNVLICTELEHQHTDECYALIPVDPAAGQVHDVGLPTESAAEQAPAGEQPLSSGHIHTDECYEISYTCGFDADYSHVHTLQCYSDAQADLEDASVWERTVAKTYAASYPVSGGSNTANPASIVVGSPTIFKLKDGETITVANIPYDVTYTVGEGDYTGEGYDAAVYDFSDSAKKIDSAEDTIGITNNKGIEVDTGINLDSLPYTLLLGFVGAALIVVLMKKRNAREN